jgi:hypothetical protein
MRGFLRFMPRFEWINFRPPVIMRRLSGMGRLCVHDGVTQWDSLRRNLKTR